MRLLQFFLYSIIIMQELLTFYKIQHLFTFSRPHHLGIPKVTVAMVESVDQWGGGYLAAPMPLQICFLDVHDH